MKKFLILASAAGIVLTATAPGFAAQRAHRATDAYASGAIVDRSGSYYYGPQSSQGKAESSGWGRDTTPEQAVRGQNLPYSDRPYGDPNRW